MTGPNFSNVNGVGGGDSTPKIPNSCNYESQQSAEVPPALNSVFQGVLNSGNCKVEKREIPETAIIETTTCNGGQIFKQDGEFTHVRVKTGKDENQCGNKFNEYSDWGEEINCTDQDDKPCK